MKKYVLNICPLIIIPLVLGGCIHSPGIDYGAMGALPEGDSAVLFAPGIITDTVKYERVVTFDPSGTELFFSVVTQGWAGQKIWASKYRGGQWQQPVLAGFSEEYNCAEPFNSPDGKKLFFVTDRPPGGGWNFDIWVMEKTGRDWSSPVRLPEQVNTGAGEWHPAVSAGGNLYFASARDSGFGGGDLYFSEYRGGNYTESRNLGPVINTEFEEWDPYVNPEETYIIFKSDRPGGFGGFDMYISMKMGGDWSTPKNLGPVVNTNIDDDSGDVTPDGRYLIFARMNEWEFMNIYWIRTKAIGAMPVQ